MSDRYAVLNYAGDVSELAKGLRVPREDGGAERTVPVLLGVDAFGAPYEVLDVEVAILPTGYVAGELTHRRRSTVHLGPASVDTMRGNRSAAAHARRQAAEQAAAHARVRNYWRPDVWAPPAPTADELEAMPRVPGLAGNVRAQASA